MKAITVEDLIEEGKVFKELLLPMLTPEEIEDAPDCSCARPRAGELASPGAVIEDPHPRSSVIPVVINGDVTRFGKDAVVDQVGYR